MSNRRFSAKQFFKASIPKVQQPKDKAKLQKSKSKRKTSDQIIDDRMEIVISSLGASSKTLKLHVQPKKQEQTLTKNQDQLKQTTQNIEENQKQPEQQTLIEPKIKQTGKSRAKIFKQELIDTIPLQNKTSLHRWNYGDGTTPTKLVIGNWNVNGIRSIISKKMIFPYINTHKPDILCITETKADEKNFDSAPISLHGYTSYWNFPKHSSGYSGVAIFTKYLPISASEDMVEREHSQEGRIITLTYQSFIIINIYVPTVGKQLERSDYRKRFDTAFRDNVRKIRKDNPTKPVIIVGDLNAALTELDTHPGKQIMLTPSFTTIERQGLQELLNMGYTDVYRALHPGVRAYTWWYVNIGGRDRLDTPGLGRRIDYFLMPNEYMRWVVRCDILREYYGADHCPVQMQLNLNLES